MICWIAAGVGLSVAYLIGATPTGHLAGRLLKGIDIREFGSRSTGATNVLRILGLWPALFVFLVDMSKGVAAIALARWFCAWLPTSFITPPVGFDQQTCTPWAVCVAGLVALLGHSRSIWLHFTGGKSAAAGLGVLLAISWSVGLGAVAVVSVALAVTRIVSLSSILGALTAVVLVFGLEHPPPYRLLVAAGGFFVILLHFANIRRIWAGTEPRIGEISRR